MSAFGDHPAVVDPLPTFAGWLAGQTGRVDEVGELARAAGSDPVLEAFVRGTLVGLFAWCALDPDPVRARQLSGVCRDAWAEWRVSWWQAVDELAAS